MKTYYAIIKEDGSLRSIESFEVGDNPENSTSILPIDIIKPIWDGKKWIENLSIEDLDAIKIEKLKEKEFQTYLKRKSDGEMSYLKLSAEFRLAKLSGQISEETHSYIEELLTPVRNEVMFGQWKKGLSILESLGVAQIGVDLYGRLHAQISNYIIENY